MNSIIEKTSTENNIKCFKCTTLCNECFDPYIPNIKEMLNRIPKDISISGCEMEAFALFYNAKREGKHASCLLSVVDSFKTKKSLSSEERQNGLNEMIKLALESSLKI